MFWMSLGFGDGLRDDGAAGMSVFPGAEIRCRRRLRRWQMDRDSSSLLLRRGRRGRSACPGPGRSARRRRDRLGPGENLLRLEERGVELPLFGGDIFGGKELPVGHDEIVDCGWRRVAPGEDVERVADDDGRRIGGIERAVGEDRVSRAFKADGFWLLGSDANSRSETECERWRRRRKLS
jgi:hypothetical protein